jgi:hypothetical protein
LASDEAGVDALFAELMQAGSSVPRVREVLARPDLDEVVMLGVLRRAVPVRFLELLALTPPWSERPRLLGGVALNPRTPRVLALRLLPSLFWRDLADVAASPRLPKGVRGRAEAILQEQLPDMRLGEKVTLAKIATTPVLTRLLAETERQIAESCLINPRLREEDLVTAVRQDTASPPRRAGVTAMRCAWRWSCSRERRWAWRWPSSPRSSTGTWSAWGPTPACGRSCRQRPSGWRKRAGLWAEIPRAQEHNVELAVRVR